MSEFQCVGQRPALVDSINGSRGERVARTVCSYHLTLRDIYRRLLLNKSLIGNGNRTGREVDDGQFDWRVFQDALSVSDAIHRIGLLRVVSWLARQSGNLKIIYNQIVEMVQAWTNKFKQAMDEHHNRENSQSRTVIQLGDVSESQKDDVVIIHDARIALPVPQEQTDNTNASSNTRKAVVFTLSNEANSLPGSPDLTHDSDVTTADIPQAFDYVDPNEQSSST